MTEYDRRGTPALSSDLLARLALALRAALLGERDEASLLPLTLEFCHAARQGGIPPEGVLLAFKNALGAPPARPYEGRYQRIRERLIAQCISAYYAPAPQVPVDAAPSVLGERRYAAVVDDDPVVVTLLRHILAPGFEVAGFDDARRALGSFYERRPDLVVFDMHLPDYSGQTLLGVLRSDARLAGVPAVAVTGDPDPALEQRLRAAGFAAVFCKPLVDADAILTTATSLALAAAAAAAADSVR